MSYLKCLREVLLCIYSLSYYQVTHKQWSVLVIREYRPTAYSTRMPYGEASILASSSILATIPPRGSLHVTRKAHYYPTIHAYQKFNLMRNLSPRTQIDSISSSLTGKGSVQDRGGAEEEAAGCHLDGSSKSRLVKS